MVVNPKCMEWYQHNKRLHRLLNYCFTEEVMAKVIECEMMNVVWLALESVYGDDSLSSEMATRRYNQDTSTYLADSLEPSVMFLGLICI
ncbi:hypothetical protein L1887_36147 [Cichorium endivia]|nr:hypothetical protein L1887_36147 [Cichorium endivia]